MYAFQLSKGEEIFEKVGPGNYSFGTKKVQAKLNNDKLLIRVGGGFMAITEFWDTYFEAEKERAIREQEKASMSPVTKKIKKALKKGKKGTASPRGPFDPAEEGEVGMDQSGARFLKVVEAASKFHRSSAQEKKPGAL